MYLSTIKQSRKTINIIKMYVFNLSVFFISVLKHVYKGDLIPQKKQMTLYFIFFN